MSDNEPKTGTIKSRNQEGTLEANTLLWNALCNKPKAIHKYLTKDAVLAEPDDRLYSPRTDPPVGEHIDDYEPWTAYRIHGEPDFVEIDLMASALIFRVTAWRLKGSEMIPTEAMCSSVWRQGPGGDWKCVLHHMTTVEDGDWDAEDDE